MSRTFTVTTCPKARSPERMLVPMQNTRNIAGFVFRKGRWATARDTQILRARADVAPLEGLRDDERAKRLADTRPSRAVSRNRNIGMPRVSGVRPDRFDHQVEFIGAVNPARSAVTPYR